MRWIAAPLCCIACLPACGYSPLQRLVDTDAGGGDVADAALAPDAAFDASEPARFVPLHVRPETLLEGAPDLDIQSIDTTALTVNDAPSPFFVRQDSYAILFARVVTVQSGLTIRGSSPLIIAASERVSISADIELGAFGPIGGPGSTSIGAGGPGTSILVGERTSSGGGGGGHGTPGAGGGTKDKVNAPAGEAGDIYGASITDPLIGGSPGGIGGFASDGGGGGGGALQISSRVSINIIAATISAGGGGGRGGGFGKNAGGGGGAGGELLLEAPAIWLAGHARLLAIGGGGGAGGCNNSSGTPGTNGSDGNSVWYGEGGTEGVPAGGAGGDGAGKLAVDAGAGASSMMGGGGGGGAGRIWLRYRAATPPLLEDPQILPAAGMDPTLP